MFKASNSGINLPEITLLNVPYTRMEFRVLGINKKGILKTFIKRNSFYKNNTK